MVLFVHDDVDLEDLFLYEKLMRSPYSITGLAGAKSFNKQSEKQAWHLSAPREDHVGEVAHINLENIWTTVFGPTRSRALTIDGLFIACKVKDLAEKGLTFDENFNFHFYDIAFCLRANEKKVACGVLPIRVIHHGLGDSMLTPDWEEANKKFKEHYCK
jgi:GT2 family glycosyltransferase